MRIDPSEAQAGDIISYVHPTDRQVRHHRVLRRAERKLGRIVVRFHGGKPVIEQEKPALRVVLLPELHSHEMAVVRQEWVPLEDVIHVRRPCAAKAPSSDSKPGAGQGATGDATGPETASEGCCGPRKAVSR